MDLDFDDFGPGAAAPKPAPRASRFLPKSAKIKPKAEPTAQPDVIKPLVEPQEPPVPQPPPFPEQDTVTTQTKPDETMLEAEQPEQSEQPEEVEVEEEPMKMEEDDHVVREIDVYFTPPPLDTNAQLYVMQYPLRPAWRPYELNDRCKEVRIKPKARKVEIDLTLDTNTNYDDDASDRLRITKQTLSSWRPPLTTSYAVGILVGNKLHLNPVHAVVQLRPSMEHLTSSGLKKNDPNVASTSKKHGKVMESPAGQGTDTEESWISLDYHGMDGNDSILSTKYRQKMTSQESSNIQFSMSSSEYISSLCPTSSTENGRDRRLSKRYLLSLSLNERFNKWFSEGSQLNRFSTLKHFAPDHSDEDIFKALESCAFVVQGLWVTRTSVFRLKGSGPIARDCVLLLFRRSTMIERRQLEEYGLYKEAEPYLNQFAVYRPSSKEWELKVPRDESFINSYPHIVKEQEKKWKDVETKLMAALGKRKSDFAKKGSSVSSGKPRTSDNPDQGAKIPVNGTTVNGITGSGPMTTSNLPKFVDALFVKYNVCSFQMIFQSLKEQGVCKAGPTPPPELQAVIDHVAIKIRNVYVLKSSGDLKLDPLRRVVIGLLGAKDPNAKLKKADIVEAAKIQLKRDINNKEYLQVMNELCVSVKGNAWDLKSGDATTKLNTLNLDP